MLSRKTLRNVEIVYCIGNYLGILPIQMNLKLGIYGNSKLLRCPTLWKINLILQIILRIIGSGFLIYQVLDKPGIIPSELVMALSFVTLIQLSIRVTAFSIFNGGNEANCKFLNKFLRLHRKLCKF